ncbi:MAG: hypothetical protein ABR511_03325 [Acidimicrobiales bacterium]
MGRRRVATGVTALVSVACTAAACGSGAGTVGTGAAPTRASTASSTSMPVADAIAPSTSVTATTRTSVPATATTSLLTAVRAAHQPGFDRVVFEFANAVPGYSVGWVERPVRQEGSGTEVAVAGPAVLEVRMAAASGVDLSPAGARTTYAGSSRITPPDTTVVREVVSAGDAEGVLRWVAGASGRGRFTVSTLEGPPRLVVDLTAS